MKIIELVRYSSFIVTEFVSNLNISLILASFKNNSGNDTYDLFLFVIF